MKKGPLPGKPESAAGARPIPRGARRGSAPRPAWLPIPRTSPTTPTRRPVGPVPTPPARRTVPTDRTPPAWPARSAGPRPPRPASSLIGVHPWFRTRLDRRAGPDPGDRPDPVRPAREVTRPGRAAGAACSPSPSRGPNKGGAGPLGCFRFRGFSRLGINLDCRGYPLGIRPARREDVSAGRGAEPERLSPVQSPHSMI
jgi:hypothetical protein